MYISERLSIYIPVRDWACTHKSDIKHVYKWEIEHVRTRIGWTKFNGNENFDFLKIDLYLNNSKLFLVD